VLGLAPLFAGVTGFITLWHNFNFIGNHLAKIMPIQISLNFPLFT
jgi:hypothetical protein